MSNRRIALLLLVPAIVMATKSHRQRHMWMHAPAEDGDAAFTGHEGHHGHGPWARRGERPGGRHVPPMFQAMLDEWHQAAHGGNVRGSEPIV